MFTSAQRDVWGKCHELACSGRFKQGHRAMNVPGGHCFLSIIVEASMQLGHPVRWDEGAILYGDDPRRFGAGLPRALRVDLGIDRTLEAVERDMVRAHLTGEEWNRLIQCYHRSHWTFQSLLVVLNDYVKMPLERISALMLFIANAGSASMSQAA